MNQQSTPTPHHSADRTVRFPGSGGKELAAIIDWPQGETRAFAIFVHAFDCAADPFATDCLSNALTAHGFAVLRFDFTGPQGADGGLTGAEFSTNAADLVAAAGWLAGRYSAPSLLVGHSLGGAAVLAAAPDIESVSAVATIGAPAGIETVLRKFDTAAAQVSTEGGAEISIAGRAIRINRQLLEEGAAQTLADRIRTGRAAKLILHSPLDEAVGISNAEEIFRAARHPKSFVSLDRADHLLSDRKDAIYAADVIGAWASRYVDLKGRQLQSEGHVAVAESGEGRYHVLINASGHPLTGDEPESAGGSNRGPSPYDLVCSGLGACTTITLRMYAERKNLPVTFIETIVTHEKQHAADAESEKPKAKIDVFTRRIRIEGDIPESVRQRMLQIANLCPVHKTLHTASVINSELLD